MKTITTAIVSMVAAVACSTAKKDLDRDTALRLVQGRREASWLSFMTNAPTDKNAAYAALNRAGVINCRIDPSLLGEPFIHECRPGANGSGLRTGDLLLQLQTGTMIPSSVTGVTKTGENSATAQIALTFEPSPLYSQYSSLFDAAEGGVYGVNSKSRRRPFTNATFQRYDDGWRLVSVD